MLILLGLPCKLSDACRRKMESFWNIPKPINLKILACFYSQILGAIWQLSTVGTHWAVQQTAGWSWRWESTVLCRDKVFSRFTSKPSALALHTRLRVLCGLSLPLWSISVLFLCFEYKLSCSSGAGFSQLFSHWLPLLAYACRCIAQASTCWDLG